MVGNFIGDFVKGSKYESYPSEIRRGILLHRKIDHYTDTHDVVKETVAMLRPEFGRYSAIVLDLYFDYFLANNFTKYSDHRSLKMFTYRFYFSVLLRYRYLPEKVKGFIFHFVGTNRLKKYETMEGLYESIEIMSRHKAPALNPQHIINYLNENQEELEMQFHCFFPQLIRYVADN